MTMEAEGEEVVENGSESPDHDLAYFKNMNREQLILYLEENIGDDVDPEQIRQMNEEQVEDFKRRLLQAMTSMNGQEEESEENVSNGTNNMAESEDEASLPNNEMSKEDSNNNKRSSSSAVTTLSSSSSRSPPSKMSRLGVGGNVNHQNIVLKQQPTGLTTEKKDIEVITLSDSDDDDDNRKNDDKIDDNQKDKDNVNQKENEDEKNLDNFSVSGNADSPRPSLKDDLGVSTELLPCQNRETLQDKIARWFQANSREFYPINSVLVPENEEAEFYVEVDDTNDDDIDQSFFGESYKTSNEPDSSNSRNDVDPDHVHDYCGAALLQAKIRITDGVRPWLNVQEDTLQNIFDLQPCYERQNFKTKCNLCNEFVRGKKNLAEHVLCGPHRRNVMNLSLKLIGKESNPSSPPKLKISEEKVDVPLEASSSNCLKNDTDKKDAMDNTVEQAKDKKVVDKKNNESSKKSIENKEKNRKPHVSQTGIRFKVTPLKSKTKLGLVSTLRSSTDNATKAPTWKRHGGKGLPVGIVPKPNSENPENTITTTTASTTKGGNTEGQPSDRKSRWSDLHSTSKYRSTYRSRSRSRDRRSRLVSKGKRSRTLSSSRRRRNRRRSSSSRDRHRSSSSRNRRRSSSSRNRRRSLSSKDRRRSRSRSRSKSKPKPVEAPKKSKSPEVSKASLESTTKQLPSLSSHPPMVCSISCEQIFFGPDTRHTEARILAQKLALMTSGKWISDVEERFKTMIADREELKQVFTQVRPVMIEKLQKHQVYETEWKIFWKRRYKQLIVEEGKSVEYADAYDYTEEWNVEWNRILLNILQKKYDQKLQDIRKKNKVDLDTLVQLNAAVATTDTNVKPDHQVVANSEDKNNTSNVISALSLSPPTTTTSSSEVCVVNSLSMMPPPPPPPPPPANAYFGLLPSEFSTTNNGSTQQSVSTI